MVINVSGLELVTPPLNGLILPGVTRYTLLDLARQWGEFDVSEREITMKELEEHANKGSVSGHLFIFYLFSVIFVQVLVIDLTNILENFINLYNATIQTSLFQEIFIFQIFVGILFFFCSSFVFGCLIVHFYRV